MCSPNNEQNAADILATFVEIASFVAEGSVRKTQKAIAMIFRPAINMLKADSEGNTYLHLAVKQGEHRILRHLLAANVGAITEVENKFQDTPLILAVDKNEIKCVKELLKYPNCLKIPNKNGNAALHFCTRDGRVDCVRVILSPNDGDKTDQEDHCDH